MCSTRRQRWQTSGSVAAALGPAPPEALHKVHGLLLLLLLLLAVVARAASVVGLLAVVTQLRSLVQGAAPLVL